MKKRLLWILIAVLLCSILLAPAACAFSAETQPAPDGGTVETILLNGNCPRNPDAPTFPDEDVHNESANSNNVTKTLLRRYYDGNGHLDWVAALTATFRFTGISAVCTKATQSYHIYDNAWRVTAADAKKSGNHASATFRLTCSVTGVSIRTEDVTLDLYCDRDGTVSITPQSAGLTTSFLRRWLDAVTALLRRLFGQ